jgi:hypothetical protein
MSSPQEEIPRLVCPDFTEITIVASFTAEQNPPITDSNNQNRKKLDTPLLYR